MATLKWFILVVSIPSAFCQNLPYQITDSAPASSRFDNEKSELGDHCTKDEECTFVYSKCAEKRCACKDYYFDQDGQCVAGLNAACQISEECKTPNAKCNEENKCKCQSNYIDIADKCMPKSKHNETCAYKVQCSETVSHTICKTAETGDKRCTCEDEYSFKNDKCYLNKSLGGICTTESVVCTTKHSDCVNKKCQCVVGYHKNEDKCAVNELGTKCEKDEDCTKFIDHSRCYEGKCDCNKYFFMRQGQCFAGMNADCKSNNECEWTNSECRDNKCQCKGRFVATSVSECLPVSQHREECKHDLQCTEGLDHTFCNTTKEAATGICDCEEAYLFQMNKCYRKKWVNDTCSEEDDVCVTVNSHCNNGRCECLPQFPNLGDGLCSSSIIVRPLFSPIVLVLLASKVMF